MTVYVGYYDFSYDGCSPPVVVFATEEQAEAWKRGNHFGAEWIEKEVEENEGT